jgi:hypothetical protein
MDEAARHSSRSARSSRRCRRSSARARRDAFGTGRTMGHSAGPPHGRIRLRSPRIREARTRAGALRGHSPRARCAGPGVRGVGDVASRARGRAVPDRGTGRRPAGRSARGRDAHRHVRGPPPVWLLVDSTAGGDLRRSDLRSHRLRAESPLSGRASRAGDRWSGSDLAGRRARRSGRGGSAQAACSATTTAHAGPAEGIRRSASGVAMRR